MIKLTQKEINKGMTFKIAEFNLLFLINDFEDTSISSIDPLKIGLNIGDTIEVVIPKKMMFGRRNAIVWTFKNKTYWSYWSVFKECVGS